MIKSIYIERLKTLKKDYSKLNKIVINKKKIVDEYIILINEVLKDIEDITKNKKIEPNIKYIEIDKKSKYIETISSKISSIQSTIEENFNKLDREKSILVESCIEEYSDKPREEVLIEIDRIFNEK